MQVCVPKKPKMIHTPETQNIHNRNCTYMQEDIPYMPRKRAGAKVKPKGRFNHLFSINIITVLSDSP